MLSLFQKFHIYFGLGLASAAKCDYKIISVVNAYRSKYCSYSCCFKSIYNVCCPKPSGIKLSNGAYYGMGGGGLVFILLVACCCWCCCRSRKSKKGQTEADPQPAMPCTHSTIAPGAHPYGMTNNSVPGGYNAPMHTAPVIKSKKSSSQSSCMRGLKMMAKVGGIDNGMDDQNTFEIAE